MEKMPGTKDKRKTEINVRLVLSLLAAIFIFLLLKIYIKNVTTYYDEEIAFVSTLLLLGGIYTGRFVSQLWIHGKKNVPAWILILLPLIIISATFFCALFASSLLVHQGMMYGLFLALPSFILCVALGMFIKLIRTRINMQLQDARAHAAQSQSELQLLHSQLSPHFLFNTLNNLYGLSITQHEKLPQLLLKLSELLRYSLYETNESLSLLQDELNYIDNYIDFEKIRIADRLVLTMERENVKEAGIKIAPMLLIVFVENAFKHSKNSTSQQIFIDIALQTWGNYILFSVKNSRAKTAHSNELPVSSGMGLANVRKRLELLYPGQYDLVIEDEAEVFNVLLRLKIK